MQCLTVSFQKTYEVVAFTSTHDVKGKQSPEDLGNFLMRNSGSWTIDYTLLKCRTWKILVNYMWTLLLQRLPHVLGRSTWSGRSCFVLNEGTMWWHGRCMERKTWVWTLVLPRFNHTAFHQSPTLPESGFWDQEMRITTRIVLICSGCLNKVSDRIVA